MKQLLLATLIAAGASLPAQAATVSKTYSYFTITGRTLDEIESQLMSRGPEVKSTGGRHPGATQMEFTTRIGYSEGKGGCSIVSAQVSVKAKVILPRWRQTGKTDADVKLIWETLSSDIKRHEESHVVIAKNHARELEQALQGISRQKTCAIAAAKAKATSDKILYRHDRAQEQFDRIEGINFESRIIRLLRYRIERLDAAKSRG
ncbi:MAG: peptidase [Mesorhizobium sp. SCN 65-20]|nr:MAG: peptidase [Mesorhizobium sp. SCN 65-20]